MKRFLSFIVLIFSPFVLHSNIDVSKTAQEFKEKFPRFSSEEGLKKLINQINDLIENDQDFKKLSPSQKQIFFKAYLYELEFKHPELFKLEKSSWRELLSFSVLGGSLPWVTSFISILLLEKFVYQSLFIGRRGVNSELIDKLFLSFCSNLPFTGISMVLFPLLAKGGSSPVATFKEVIKPTIVIMGAVAFSCIFSGFCKPIAGLSNAQESQKFVADIFHNIESKSGCALLALLGYIVAKRKYKEKFDLTSTLIEFLSDKYKNLEKEKAVDSKGIEVGS